MNVSAKGKGNSKESNSANKGKKQNSRTEQKNNEDVAIETSTEARIDINSKDISYLESNRPLTEVGEKDKSSGNDVLKEENSDEFDITEKSKNTDEFLPSEEIMKNEDVTTSEASTNSNTRDISNLDSFETTEPGQPIQESESILPIDVIKTETLEDSLSSVLLDNPNSAEKNITGLIEESIISNNAQGISDYSDINPPTLIDKCHIDFGGIADFAEQAFDGFEVAEKLISICVHSTFLLDLAKGSAGTSVALTMIRQKLDCIDKKVTALMVNDFKTATKHIERAIICMNHHDMSKAIYHLNECNNLTMSAMSLTCKPDEAVNCANLTLFAMFLIESFNEETKKFVPYEKLEQWRKRKIAELTESILKDLFDQLKKFQSQNIISRKILGQSGLQVL